MIRITIDLVSARTGETTRIGCAVIRNDGTGTRTRGNYDVMFGSKRKSAWRTAHVVDYPRLSKNVWYPVYRALKVALNA